jgi:hypothetical protein
MAHDYATAFSLYTQAATELEAFAAGAGSSRTAEEVTGTWCGSSLGGPCARYGSDTNQNTVVCVCSSPSCGRSTHNLECRFYTTSHPCESGGVSRPCTGAAGPGTCGCLHAGAHTLVRPHSLHARLCQAQAQQMATMAQAAQVGAKVAQSSTAAVKQAGGATVMGGAAALGGAAGLLLLGPVGVRLCWCTRA